jgi:hypothetical protein
MTRRRFAAASGAPMRVIEASDASLVDGFHDYEAVDDIRWTDGDAGVPDGLFDGLHGPLEVIVSLSGRTSYVGGETADARNKDLGFHVTFCSVFHTALKVSATPFMQ